MFKKHVPVGNTQHMSNQMQEDWQVTKSVLECNKYMFEQQINCNVTFLTGDGNKNSLKIFIPGQQGVWNNSFEGT